MFVRLLASDLPHPPACPSPSPSSFGSSPHRRRRRRRSRPGSRRSTRCCRVVGSHAGGSPSSSVRRGAGRPPSPARSWSYRRRSRLGGVRGRAANARPARLGAPRRRGRGVDDPSARRHACRMVRRRPAPQRRLRARGARRCATLTQVRRGATHPSRARRQLRLLCSAIAPAGIAAWWRGALWSSDQRRGSGDDHQRASTREGKDDGREEQHEQHDGGATRTIVVRVEKGGTLRDRGGELCNRSGASPVYASRGSRSARCGARPGGGKSGMRRAGRAAAPPADVAGRHQRHRRRAAARLRTAVARARALG